MQKTLITILITLTLAITSVFALMPFTQAKIDWTQLTSFRIYDYKTFPQDKDINTFSDDDIQQMNFIATNLDDAKKILSKAKPLGNKTYLWKGHHFAMATFTNGEKRRIKISGYGGFFMDMTTKEYYGFNDNARKDWDKFWSDNYKVLHKQQDSLCDKCNIENLKLVNQRLESLTFKIVNDFLCTFDSSCVNNAEFSEWSNELLFKVIEKSPSMFFEVVATGKVNNELLLNTIKSPLLDIDLQNIYNKIKAAPGVTSIKTKYLNAIIIASEKGGTQIRK